jgi:hypothetical protein
MTERNKWIDSGPWGREGEREKERSYTSVRSEVHDRVCYAVEKLFVFVLLKAIANVNKSGKIIRNINKRER